MKFSTFTTAFALAGSAFAAPAKVARQEYNQPSQASQPSIPEVAGISNALVTDLAPGVALTLLGLGLGGLAPGLTGLLGSVTSNGQGGAGLPLVGDLPVVSELVSQVPVDISLPDLSSEGLSTDQVKQVAGGLNHLIGKLNLANIQNGQLPQLDGISDEALSKVATSVQGLLSGLNIQQLAPGLSSLPIPQPQAAVGLLASLAPYVTTLLSTLGLSSLATGVTSLLGHLSNVL